MKQIRVYKVFHIDQDYLLAGLEQNLVLSLNNTFPFYDGTLGRALPPVVQDLQGLWVF